MGSDPLHTSCAVSFINSQKCWWEETPGGLQSSLPLKELFLIALHQITWCCQLCQVKTTVALSSQVRKTSRDRFPQPPGTCFQCYTALQIKEFFLMPSLNLPSYSLWSYLLLDFCHYQEEFVHLCNCPLTQLQAADRSFTYPPLHQAKQAQSPPCRPLPLPLLTMLEALYWGPLQFYILL